MKPLFLDIPWPAGGINKGFSYENQPPVTTPDAVNVRPYSVASSVSDTDAELRLRGGSRPGTGKAYLQEFGDGNPIRLLSTVTLARQDSVFRFIDEFTGTTLASYWDTAVWVVPPAAPRPYPDDMTLLVFDGEGAVVREPIPFDSSQPYTIALRIEPYLNEHWGTYKIFARMNEAVTPFEPNVLINGMSAELVLNGTAGTYSGTLKVYVNSVLTSFSFASGATTAAKAEPGVFSVRIEQDQVTCLWIPESDPAQTITLLLDQVIPTQTGTRFGFGMAATVAAGITLVDRFSISYIRGDRRAYVNPLRVVTSSNGVFYVENNDIVTMDPVSTTVNLASDRQISATELNGNLFIADYSQVWASGVDGELDATGRYLIAESISDWTTLGVDAPNGVVVLDNVQGAAVAGTYPIEQVSAEQLMLTRSATSGVATGDAFFRVERAPKVYNGADNTLTLWQAEAVDPDASPVVYKGQVPTGCPLIATYRGRIVLGGASVAPNVWYMSRQDNPYDWDYGQTDAQAAVAGNNSDAGRIGDPLTAIVPFSDDYLIFGCPSQIWVLRGDPTFGGELANLSRTVGIGWQKSWCHGPSGEVIFLSYNGLYVLPPGSTGVPQQLSRISLPIDLTIPDQERDDYEVLMEYDTASAGVHIYITKTIGDEEPGKLYWFAWDSKSFWRVTMPETQEPTAICAVNTRFGKDSPVLIGCRDGRIRAFRDAFLDDDGEEMESYVFLGPIKYSKGGDIDCKLQQLIGILSTSSGSVKWELFSGFSAEEAFNSTAVASSEWTRAGRNYTDRPARRGVCFYLKLSNVDNLKPWTMERITAVMETYAPARLL